MEYIRQADKLIDRKPKSVQNTKGNRPLQSDWRFAHSDNFMAQIEVLCFNLLFLLLNDLLKTKLQHTIFHSDDPLLKFKMLLRSAKK